MPRIANSNTIPTFLQSALSSIRQSHKGSAQLNAVAPTIRKASVNALPVSCIAQRKLVAHGAGVYEDPQNHSIWYREGEILKRREADIDQIINDYVSSIK